MKNISPMKTIGSSTPWLAGGERVLVCMETCATNELRDERRAAPSRPAGAMCSQLNAAGIAAPSGAEAGHRASRGRPVPAEELRRETQRGLQDRSGGPAFSGA
mmetsp:Transcript_1410/g.4203  ORF Transcript_1410/g.4203 Transcript_1410/m.4203 type:complete len:103 (-) Transcript_1410:1499-1807(-)